MSPEELAAIREAVDDLDSEHAPEDVRGGRLGCQMCWPKDGSWPCVSRLIADDLRRLL